MVFDIPDSCTLPTAERPVRLAEFNHFIGSATSMERKNETRLILGLDDADGFADRVRDLAARESECCSFFEFAVARNHGRLTIEIGVPTQHSDVLDALQQGAARRS